jgi:hypothetical protein
VLIWWGEGERSLGRWKGPPVAGETSWDSLSPWRPEATDSLTQTFIFHSAAYLRGLLLIWAKRLSTHATPIEFSMAESEHSHPLDM